MGDLFNKEWIEKQILSIQENPTEFVLGIYKDENCGVYSLVRKTGKIKDLILTNQIFNDKEKFDNEVKMISLLFNPIILEEIA